MPPGRPIISDCDSERYRVAEYIDHFLQEFYKKNTRHTSKTRMTSLLNFALPKFNHTPIDYSRCGNYVHKIDNDQGLEAVINVFYADTSPRRSDKHILELLELSLKNSDFEFNNESFLQISGTAMSRKFVPRCANHGTMGKYTPGKMLSKPTIYFEYLDDLWILWDHGETQFQTFFDTLNTHSSAIRLTARI